MNKLIITRGIPGSGKTTWAKKWVEENPSAHIRVNRDDIRNMLGPYWVPEREELVTIIERTIVSKAIIRNYSVVVDATNFDNLKVWEWYIEMARKAGIDLELEVKDFTDVPLEVCIERDSKRENPVGEEVIRKFHKRIK